jgi:hypothetical protein
MRTLPDGLSALLAAREIDSLRDIRGRMSQRNLKNPTAFERANYVDVMQGYPVPLVGHELIGLFACATLSVHVRCS